LASKPKKLALKDWINNSNLDVIFLQETLGKASEIEPMLKTLLPGWIFSAAGSSGHSGGIAIGLKKDGLKVINQWGMKNVMGMEVISPDFSFPITLVNIYGPCQGRESFWEDLMTKSVMKSPLMIMGGDLNFSIGRAEAWGPSAREDPFQISSLTSSRIITS
jgi:exonuclease III